MRKAQFLWLGILTMGLIQSACRPVKVKSELSSDASLTPEAMTASSYDNVSFEKAICAPGSLRVIGGQAADAGSLVAQGSVKIWVKGQRFCSGTLIGPQHIVTAAHCFREQSLVEEIRLGFGTEGQADDNLRVLSYRLHPKYVGIPSQVTAVPQFALYDVAVLTFQGQVPESARPVALAKPSYLAPGIPLIVRGYGAYNSDDKQRRPLTSVEVQLDQIFPDQRELQLKRGEAKGACFGDSGGPTFIAGEQGACLFLVGSTTGPGRNTKGTCEPGGGTLMDLTRYQGWMSCAFRSMGTPLTTLQDDASLADCQ